jgi:hypothetical protein
VTNNSVYWSSRSAQHVSDKRLPFIRSVRLQITACGMVSCCSGGLAVRRVAAWYYVLGVKEDAWGGCLSGILLHTKHIGPRCRPPDRQRITTTGHHTTCCNLQSYAPYDGQMFVRNMLSCSWRSINTVICRKKFYVDFLPGAILLSFKRRPTFDYSLKIPCHQACCTCRSKTGETTYLPQHTVFTLYG